MLVTCAMTYYTTAEQEEELTDAVNSALEEMQMEGMSTNQKIITIHDYICNHVDYADEYYENEYGTEESNLLSHTAYSALCEEKAVC